MASGPRPVATRKAAEKVREDVEDRVADAGEKLSEATEKVAEAAKKATPRRAAPKKPDTDGTDAS